MIENIFVPDNPNDLELVITLTKKLAAECGLPYQELGMVDSHPEMNLTPSDEGKILINHNELLLSLGKDGFISLHEAPEKNMFYVYVFEKGERPSSIARELLRVGAEEFGAAAEGTTMQYGGTAKDGIIFNFHDSSFEDFMFENGVPHSIVTETPTSGNLEKRIKTITEIIDTFIRLARA
jgi:hypothetical protein